MAMKERIAQLEKQMLEVLKKQEVTAEKFGKLPESKLKYGIGKWYIDFDDDLFFAESVNKQSFIGEFNGYYVNGDKGIWNTTNQIKREATTKEIETSLVKEAIRIGFKEGARVTKHPELKKFLRVLSKDDYHFSVYQEQIRLSYDDYILFQGGKWAEIIKEQPLTLNGHEVKIGGDTIRIGCKDNYNLEDFETFVSSLVFFGVTTLNGPDGCYTVEDLKKIIDQINK